MADLVVQQLSADGVTVPLVAADVAGDTFLNTRKTILIVNNSDTVAHSVTIDSVKQCDHGFDHDLTVSVAAGEEKKIGAFPSNRFNNADDKVSVSYDSVTGITVGACSL